MLPRGNNEIPGYQFIDKASQNDILSICTVKKKQRKTTGQQPSRQLSQNGNQCDRNKPNVSRGNQIAACGKRNAVHRHVADNVNPTSGQNRPPKLLLGRAERASWTAVRSRTWEKRNPDAARADNIEHGENADHIGDEFTDSL